MKKILMFACAFVMIVTLVGCGSDVEDAQIRARIKVDKAKSTQIGKAIMIWDDEYNSDTDFKNRVENSGSALSTEWTKCSDLGCIEEFVPLDSTMLVLKDADYYVAKNAEESYKIIIGISNNNGADLLDPKDVTKVDEYNGESSAVVWVEPKQDIE